MNDGLAIGAFERLTDLTGCAGLLFTIAALLAGFAASLPTVGRLPLAIRRRVLAVTAAAAVVLMCWPIRGLPAVAYLRAVTEDLSVTTLVLAAGLFVRAMAADGWNPCWRDRTALRVLVVIGSLLLYPMALGATPIDSYRWGYANPWFIAALLVIALAALRAGLRLTTLSLSLAVLGYGLGVHEARNLWNYLIDPFVAIQCALALPLGALRRLLKRSPRQAAA